MTLRDIQKILCSAGLDQNSSILGADVSFHRDWMERQTKIRAYYKCVHKQIMDSPRNRWAVDPYEVDWIGVFTPIEYLFWQDIRAAGAVLYPQYPVGPYMVDFGNPKARVAVECDGKHFHKDKEKDERRATAIRDIGWSIYRISGRSCYENDIERETDEGIEIERSAGRSLVEMICSAHDISIKAPPFRESSFAMVASEGSQKEAGQG